MKTVQERAYAKINLTLGVRSRRADGYHELDMLMQTVDLYDSVTVSTAAGVTVTATGMTLPYNNTLRKAAEYYKLMTGKGSEIRVVKRIPSQAGLGGGSADAAAVLRALDRLYGETDRQTLKDIALKVGADVPFCLQGGFCRAEGIGERLTPLKGMPLFAVIVKPEKGVSTKRLFESLALPLKMPDTTRGIRAVAGGDLPELADCLYNSLEEPAIGLVPEIGVLKERLLKLGAAGASMTGSGSAVFGLFRSFEEAQSAVEQMSDVFFRTAVRSTP